MVRYFKTLYTYATKATPVTVGSAKRAQGGTVTGIASHLISNLQPTEPP